jgi:hypothetical protein
MYTAEVNTYQGWKVLKRAKYLGEVYNRAMGKHMIENVQTRVFNLLENKVVVEWGTKDV